MARPEALSALVGAGPTYCVMSVMSFRKQMKKWKSNRGGFEASELQRVKDAEDEVAKLKRMYTNLALENTAMKDANPVICSVPILAVFCRADS